MIDKKELELAIREVTTPKAQEPERVTVPIGKTRFSALEKRAMDAFVAQGLPDLHLYPKDALLEAYLAGADVGELCMMYPETQIGGLVYLKHSEEWPKLRQEFLQDLQYKSQLKLLQTKAMAVSNMSLIVNAFHKELQPKIIEYMKTGDPGVLPEKFNIKSFKDYSRFVELMGKLSKLSPGEAFPIEALAQITIKTENISIGDKPNSNKVSTEKVQSAAFDILNQLYGDK